MPLGEEHSNRIVVSVGGTVVPPDMQNLLVSAYVDDSVHVPSMFVLRFSDPEDKVLSTIRAEVGTEVSVAVQQSGQGSPVELINGDITALEREIDERGVFTEVRGLDVRHRLLSGAGIDAFVNMSVSDIVAKVAGDSGVEARVGSFTPVHDHRARSGESALDFLGRLARGVGAVMHVEGRTLCFEELTKASSASAGTSSRNDAFVIEHGGNLISLRATLTGTGQVPELEVRGWDPATKAAVSGTGRTASPSAVVTTTPAALAGKVSGTKHVISTTLTTQGEARTLATAEAGARAGSATEVEGVVRGNPKLRAGAAIRLLQVGASFDGKYVLTAVRHDVDPLSGYLTSFTAADTSDRSLYGIVAGAPATLGSANPRQYATTAVVTNLKDPDGLGRVKVKFPSMSADYESWWARPVQVGAGANRGASWLPEVNDEVLVAFGDGSFDEPYILGGLYNGKDKAGGGWAAHVNSSDGTVKRRAFTSRNGMLLEFLEDGQADTLTVSTNDGAQHLTFTQTGEKGIVVVSKGKLEVTADRDVVVVGKQNISVTTDTGDLTLSGNNITLKAKQNVKVEAGINLDLKGTQVAAEGTAGAELKGANVKVNGQATTELASSGVTTVRGSLVKIN